jgi:hypothetical protein
MIIDLDVRLGDICQQLQKLNSVSSSPGGVYVRQQCSPDNIIVAAMHSTVLHRN